MSRFILDDKGYDSQPLREELLEKGVTPVIPRRGNSDKPNPYFDRELYKARHTIENLFAKMKRFRGFATRFDKLKRNYAAVVAIVCCAIWLGRVLNWPASLVARALDVLIDHQSQLRAPQAIAPCLRTN